MKRLALGALLFMAATTAAGQEAELIGGRPAEAGAFPASVYASMGGSRCTATVIGEKTLLIAAHCVNNGGTATFSAGGASYSSRCTHAPTYTRDSTADWALCLIERKVEGIPYENINVDASIHTIDQEVLLTGYGCVRQGGGGGNDGVYRIGEAKIRTLPNSSSNDIVTRGTAALCFGDSGGPAFLYLDAAKTKRVLISVNSRGDISTTSYLSSISTERAKAFLTDWTTRNSAKVCGMHADAQGCRDSEPTDPEPEECSGVAAHVATWTSCLTAAAKPSQSDCEAAQDAMNACFNARYP